MSVETKLAALRMQERELLNVACARCGHRLGGHSRVNQYACIGKEGVKCGCRGFVDPGERLELK